MPDVIAMGEALIDFVSSISGVTLIDAPSFMKAAGGAPANVAVGLAKLGVSSGFMGKVGDDAFGHFLSKTMEEAGVDVQAMRYSTEARTTLAFVSLQEDGERDFMFYRHPSADMLYRADEIDETYIRSASILHFGSISLIDEPSRSATHFSLEIAAEAGLLISYDPNLRMNLWPDAATAKSRILSAWPLAHVIKISDEELGFLTAQQDPLKGGEALWHEGLKALIITHGSAGCTFLTPTFTGTLPGFVVKSMDTTGAGDGFVAGLLKGVLGDPGVFNNKEAMRRICEYANAVGALTTTQRGAIPALPSAKTVQEFLRERDEI
jgi:fructokinase